MIRPLAAALAAALLAPAAQAALLIAVDGTPDPTSGARLDLAGSPAQVLVTGFRLDSPTSDIHIDAVLARSRLQPVTGLAWLSTAIGPGATAADVVAQRAFALPFADLPDGNPAPGWVAVFDGLALDAGTYYLTLAADNGAAGWFQSGQPAAVTEADGAELLGFDFSTPPFAVDTLQPWASDFGTPLDWGGRPLWRLQGTGHPAPQPVPEPTTAALVALALAAAAWRRRAARR